MSIIARDRVVSSAGCALLPHTPPRATPRTHIDIPGRASWTDVAIGVGASFNPFPFVRAVSAGTLVGCETGPIGR